VNHLPKALELSTFNLTGEFWLVTLGQKPPPHAAESEHPRGALMLRT